MSIATVLARRGSKAAVYRPTWTTSSDGSRVISSYGAPIARGVGLVFQPIGDSLAQKSFGTQEVIDDRGWALPAAELQPHDRILVTSGHRSGSRYIVVEVQPWVQRSGDDHLELALQSTTEVFP